ncbi:MAG: cell envelope integrity EipB family protein [Alphaproteobacteria bacterium]|nr:cell envelope integrity EipB family protein [Alphaproteobacteria bacterium]
MKFLHFFPVFAALFLLVTANAQAMGLLEGKKAAEDVTDLIIPHKALYDIQMVETRSGSNVINISGKMYYEWKPSCDGWITDHRFNLIYEYADSPGMRITSDFSTFETFDGESFSFSARRKRDNTLYEELRGRATTADKGGVAKFTMPDDLKFDLAKGAMFPMAHTVEMIEKARANKKFFQAVVFDGSDDEGPVEINTFIGNEINPMKEIDPSESLDMSLLNTKAWKVRMAVFPTIHAEEASDYEMDMIFHENGVISDMKIDYDDFSVTQKLVALERVQGDQCSREKQPEKTSQTSKNNQ